MKRQPAFTVRYTDAACEDLLRLFDFLLECAETAEDFDLVQLAVDAMAEAVDGHLGRTPFIFRKAGASPFQRELTIPFGHGGYVDLYEIDDASTVNVRALRHQREDDYH